MKPQVQLQAIGAIFLAISVFGASSAHAADANFCAADDECTAVYVENNASATVRAVNLTQKQGDSSCERVKKTVSRDMVGGTEIDPGQSFRFSANAICKYKVVYETTTGCAGDKTTHIRPADFAKTYDTVKLLGDCGTLNAKVARTRTDLDR